MNNIYTEQINKSLEALFTSIKGRFSATDMQRVKDAYDLASVAHKEQYRKSGEPYIIHPISVARIVAEELELGVNPIIAAFLHDVVEDTSYTIEDIRDKFGDDVAFLVRVVTKRKKDKYDKSKQVDNYRQILASVHYDVRAILIKLADRLHNMRTLESMRADKQMKIASETEYFYAPLANRLGLYHVKSELENLSFRYRCPREYAEVEACIKNYKQKEKYLWFGFVNKLNKILCLENVRVEVCHRTPYSIWRKMQTLGCEFTNVGGKYYIRIIYSCDKSNDKSTEKALALHIYAKLTDVFKEIPGTVINYIDNPKENGYQSFHVRLLSEQGCLQEIHISSDRMVRASRLGCAAERTEENVYQWLWKFKKVLTDMAFHSKNMDFMDGVTASFYNDDIMVFTPHMKCIILPKNATALDFAFEIHSEVGLHAVYARINGKLMPVTTELHRGDCVEIGTDEKSLPDAGWINHVLTYKAIKNLSSYLSNVKKIDYKLCPNCNPLPGDEVIGFKDDNGDTIIHMRKCKTAISIASQQCESIFAVDFNEDENILYPVSLYVKNIERNGLLSDIIDYITETLHLSINKFYSTTIDRITTNKIDFMVHSAQELDATIKHISAIRGVEEVHRVLCE